VAEGVWQVDGEELTGRQTITMRARARVDQDAVRQLPTGEADLIVRGLAERVRMFRTRVPAAVETVAQGLTGTSSGQIGPPRFPATTSEGLRTPEHRSFRCVPHPLPGSGGPLLCLRRNLSGGHR
jgi:hypothetical protein